MFDRYRRAGRRAGVVFAALYLAFAAPAFGQVEPGRWYVTAQPDRFGDGGTFVALTGARSGTSVAFAVRCIRRAWSLAVIDMGFDPKPLQPGDAFTMKFRVDGGTVREAVGVAIGERTIQFAAAPAMIADILGGRELAMRLDHAGTSVDVIFGIGNARKALVRHLAECPKVD